MKVIWIILWATLVSFCLTAPVDDINLNERPKDELLSMIESLNDKLPFLSGLRYWIAELPDFKDPLKITEFTHWYETIVFPEMKRAVPIVAEALAHGGSRSSKDQDSYDTVRGLRAITHLLGRIRLDLANVSNQNVPIELHQALHNWTLVFCKYVFERQRSTIMGLSRGLIHKPTVSGAEGFKLTEQIVFDITLMKYAQFIHNLYETGTTIEQKIYGDFVQTQNDASFSIEMIEQLVAKYHPYSVNYQKKLTVPGFIEIVNVKYIPASTVENSDNPQPSHTLTSDNPDGDSLGAKLKRPSIEQTPTLETPIQNYKRQKPPPKDSASLNVHSALLKSVLEHSDVIDTWLLNWTHYEKNTDFIDLSKFSQDLEISLIYWMKNIEILLEMDTLESLGPAIKALSNVYAFLGKLSKKFPKEVFERVTFARFWKNYYQICFQQIYIKWKSSISEKTIVAFMKESFLIATLMKLSRGLFEILSEGKTAESMIDENIKKFRQKSEISQEDVEQFAAINWNFLHLTKDDTLRKISNGMMVDDFQQRMQAPHDLASHQFDSSHPSVNPEHFHEEQHRHDPRYTIGESSARLTRKFL